VEEMKSNRECMNEQINNSLENQNPTKNRITRVRAFVLASLTIFSLACVAFAYTQRMEAQRLKDLSIRCHEELLRVEKMAAQARDEAEQQKQIAVKQAYMAIEALENCKKGK
jgi:hypothetical protein